MIMKNIIRKKLIYTLCVVFCFCLEHAYARSGPSDHNPASIAYVNTAIGLALQTVTYRAGDGIRIDQPGNVIVATGATEAYVGVGAINISNADVSARFAGTNGIYIPVSSDGDNTGLIQGPSGGTGITVTESTSGPGTINLDTTYEAGAGIAFTGSSTKMIGITPQVSVGDLYQGGIVFYVDETLQHGLAIALKEQEGGDPYFETTPTHQQFAWGSGIGSGAINTANLAARATDGFPIAAARALLWGALDSGVACLGLTVTPCYGGFYLGAVGEWRLIIDNLSVVNAAILAHGGDELLSGADDFYWTSTESNIAEAYAIRADDGETFVQKDKTETHLVRAIRRF
ncbi:MAG: hypothetical protein P1U61_03790 [Legionellaceae bacterium]|nr:hypothetical protein [Legionellaceae bacterium]